MEDKKESEYGKQGKVKKYGELKSWNKPETGRKLDWNEEEDNKY